jgi:hypothetical protein
MGYNARNDEIRDNLVRMQRKWEAERNALATVRRFNAQLGQRICMVLAEDHSRNHSDIKKKANGTRNCSIARPQC